MKAIPFYCYYDLVALLYKEEEYKVAALKALTPPAPKREHPRTESSFKVSFMYANFKLQAKEIFKHKVPQR
jgi:hypothetical protein